jgi:surface antigen
MKRTMTLVSILAAAAIATTAFGAERTGGVAGALFFGKLGPTMQESDKQKAIESVRSGEPATWKNASTGNEYTFTPAEMTKGPSGECRSYVITGKIGDKSEEAKGTACRKGGGDWSGA